MRREWGRRAGGTVGVNAETHELRASLAEGGEERGSGGELRNRKRAVMHVSGRGMEWGRVWTTDLE